MSGRVFVAMVIRVRCRMCHARPGRPCIAYGSADRTDGFRRTNPHQLRLNDATADRS